MAEEHNKNADSDQESEVSVEPDSREGSEPGRR
jgi:hypothetical protein